MVNRIEKPARQRLLLTSTALETQVVQTPAPEVVDTMTAQWEKFRTAAVPTEAPEVQVRAMKRAFYAGATGYVGALSAGLRSTESAVVEDPDTVMRRLCLELDEFAREVWHGRV